MHSTTRWTLVAAASSLALLGCAGGTAQQDGGPQQMSFFLTSVNPGKGGDLGGLAGADAYCQKLASAAGAAKRNWRAYLSTQGVELGDKGIVHARDRIGNGPWYNVKGVLIAQNLAELHTDKANINNDTALDEQGRTINMQGAPNRHDILTGSTTEGRATDMTCQNWTSSGSEHNATVGHHDRLTFGKPGSPWNSAHPSKGCSQENFVATGGAGLIYCFAAK